MADEEDARSDESFQSADEEDDFDLPQDVGAIGLAASSGGAQPPGLDGEDGEDPALERWNLRKDGNREQLDPIFNRLNESKEHVKISKMFSYVLRHAAHKLDVRIRKDGFVRLKEIMKLRNFKPYNLEELMAVVYFDEKERYTMCREFDGELLIRANQGHTMKVVDDELLLELISDPETVGECVHGTYLVHWPFIKRQGLSKVARNHIHLANGLPEDGKIRGMRSTAELFVYVDVPKAMQEGVIFYRSKNEVILTQGDDGWLAAKYFIKAVRIDYNTCELEHMDFDLCERPNWPSELAPSGPGDAGTYMIKNLEAIIAGCRKRYQEITELKALQDSGKEIDAEQQEKVAQQATVYTELQSLEQRFRQHKGHRRENQQEREQRIKDEAEATTVTKRQDRAVTPPWERGKANLDSVGKQASEKDKAQWAALGKRRDTAEALQAATPKMRSEDDQWEKLGRGRLESATPKMRSEDDHPGPLLRKHSSESQGDAWRADARQKGGSAKPSLPDDASWRRPSDSTPKAALAQRPQELGWRAGEAVRPGATPQATPQATPTGDRPKFFNSKKSSDNLGSWRERDGPGVPRGHDDSWRERSRTDTARLEEVAPQLPPSLDGLHDRQPPPPPAGEPSWRGQLSAQTPSFTPMSQSGSGQYSMAASGGQYMMPGSGMHQDLDYWQGQGQSYQQGQMYPQYDYYMNQGGTQSAYNQMAWSAQPTAQYAGQGKGASNHAGGYGNRHEGAGRMAGSADDAYYEDDCHEYSGGTSSGMFGYLTQEDTEYGFTGEPGKGRSLQGKSGALGKGAGRKGKAQGKAKESKSNLTKGGGDDDWAALGRFRSGNA